MKVLLQDTISKRYYAGPQRWVEARSEALDFRKVDLAAKAYTEESAHFAEIVLDDGKLPAGPPPPKRHHSSQRPRPPR